MSIIFTGGSGFLGKTLKKLNFNAEYISSKDVDLTNQQEVNNFFLKVKPTTIIHAANKVGGILKNASCMYEFYYHNLLINSFVIDYCIKNNVNLIYLSSTCVYPKKSALYPLTENMLHDGLPEETNLGYAYSKRAADIQLWSAEKQYGYKNYTILYLSNLYGYHDHYFSKESHFVASFISKLLNSTTDEIELYGTGNPLRQFTYADDIYNVLNHIMENNIYGRFNISNPENLSILKMTQIIMDKFNIHKNIKFNNHLDGVYRKDVSIEKYKSVNKNFNFTTFENGIKFLAEDIKCFGI
jgi:GDP-L-fucose synthase